jgi:hypothetical protein
MANVKVVPRSLTEAYKRREGDFSPNLVGLQFTDGVSLFTFGNFQVTTNLQTTVAKDFVLGGQWSEYYSLDNLNITESESLELQSNEIFIRLNFNIYDVSRYAYFGSFYELTRVSIEQIIQKWKGSLYLNPQITNTAFNTVLSFSYSAGTNTAKFLIPTSVIQNPYQLIYETNDDIDLGSIPSSEIYNLNRDYAKYIVWNDQKEFNIIDYEGSTSTYPYVTIYTSGNPFPSLTGSTFGQFVYHIRPNKTEVELFFNSLTDFERILLNRLTSPAYTSYYTVPESYDGNVFFNEKYFTWPTTDGFNLDNSGRDYGSFITGILEMATNFDLNKTDLVARKFVAESIIEYDTNGGGDPVYGKKVNKLLRIYGREFDEIKKYIDGISFANVVTYDKLDNTSDELIKVIAKNLGFDVLLTLTTDNFNLLEQIQPSFVTPFSGYSRSLSAKELDIELWRRLVINAWWLFRSKGTRKVIEFFFSLFKIPQCMISLDEYVYLAENRLDTTDVYNQITNILGSDTQLSLYPIDDYGFPRVLPETPDNYFQNGGFWYNGGNETTVGNNPHIGPYDFGQKYFQQFKCFVNNFQEFVTGSTLVTVVKNYFDNYNEGTFVFDQNGLPVPYYGTPYANFLNNNNVIQNAVVTSAGLTYVGGTNSPNYGVPSGDTFSMKISFKAGTGNYCGPCNYNLVYGNDGIVYISGSPNTYLTTQSCCQNYWLPTNNITVPCPRTSELAIDINGIVLYNNVTLSQACCTSSVVGSNVYWNGTACVLQGITPSCPRTSELAIDINGIVLYNNVTLSQACCTQAVAGAPVTWDGSQCLVTQEGGSGIGFGPAGGGGVAVDLGGRIALPPTEPIVVNPPIAPTPSYLCYWCPPVIYTQQICTSSQYLNLLTSQEIIQLAITLGATYTVINSPNGTQLQNATNFLTPLFDGFFQNNGCIIFDNNNREITNSACCTRLNGTWTNINNRNYCVVPGNSIGSRSQISTPPCPQTTVNQYNIFVDSNGDPVGNNCCSNFNINGRINLYVNGVLNSVISDNPAIAFMTNYLTNLLGSTYNFTTNSNPNYGYCPDCPQEVNLLNTGDVVDYTTNTSLTQSCCTQYGYFYNVALNKCTICSPAVNYGTGSNANLITNLDNSDLSQQCCDNIGGWYGFASYDNNNVAITRCYICPPINVIDPNTLLLGPNNNYQWSQFDYTNSISSCAGTAEVLYNNSSLDVDCCNYYATNYQYDTNLYSITYDGITNKCKICQLQ